MATKKENPKLEDIVISDKTTDNAFCPDCKSLTTPRDIEDLKGVLLFYCKRCDTHYKKVGKPLIITTPMNKDLGVAIIDSDRVEGYTIDAGCEKCNNTKAYIQQFPPAWGDEGDLRIYKCTKCGYCWRDQEDYGM